jgi:hypothetical protein
MRFAASLSENVSRVRDFVQNDVEAYYLVEDFSGNDLSEILLRDAA